MTGASASVAASNDRHVQRGTTRCVDDLFVFFLFCFFLSVVCRTRRVWRHSCYAERDCRSSAEDFMSVPCTVRVLNKVQLSGR